MIVFRIAAEPEGWYVDTDTGRSGPCLSIALAVERAEGMIAALRTHGEDAVLEASEPKRTTPARWPGERAGATLSL
ncbi:MAG TPA: hypothetical protein VN805_02380 [Caulobacteraceae bacterium]|nr:hypothetical protein [Caulobacteraceae bacterium]